MLRRLHTHIIWKILPALSHSKLDRAYAAALSYVAAKGFTLEHVSYSLDSHPSDIESANSYTQEFLNSFSPDGVVPDELRLRRGALLILLRNYSPREGLCNGTWLVVERVVARLLIVRVVTGVAKGNIIEALPRICCDSSGNADLPFVLRRHQFPVKLAWCMTINKSQGQTFAERLWIYLPTPVLSHGQLYVALSRGVSFSKVRVLAQD